MSFLRGVKHPSTSARLIRLKSSPLLGKFSQRLHGNGIFSYMSDKNQPNLRKHTVWPIHPKGVVEFRSFSGVYPKKYLGSDERSEW